MKSIKSAFLLAFCALFMLSDSTAIVTFAQENYRTYQNARFAYAISYPADLLIAQGESDNGDGQRFLSKDGRAVMLVYGSNNALNQTLKQVYDEETASGTKGHPGRSISYKVLKADWFAVSGTEDGKIFYQKTYLKKSVFKTFRIEYDEAQKAIYDSLTSTISKSFKG